MTNTVTVWGSEWLEHLPAPLPGLFGWCEMRSAGGPRRLVSYDLNSPHVREWVEERGVRKTLSSLEHLSEAVGLLASVSAATPIATERENFDNRTEFLRSWWAAILRAIEDVRRQPVLDPSCLTSTVVSLAEGIHADRAFDRLPILADALQDAGCEDEDILDHCRTPGPHGHGCCVIDLVKGTP